MTDGSREVDFNLVPPVYYDLYLPVELPGRMFALFCVVACMN